MRSLLKHDPHNPILRTLPISVMCILEEEASWTEPAEEGRERGTAENAQKREGTRGGPRAGEGSSSQQPRRPPSSDATFTPTIIALERRLKGAAMAAPHRAQRTQERARVEDSTQGAAGAEAGVEEPEVHADSAARRSAAVAAGESAAASAAHAAGGSMPTGGGRMHEAHGGDESSEGGGGRATAAAGGGSILRGRGVLRGSARAQRTMPQGAAGAP